MGEVRENGIADRGKLRGVWHQVGHHDGLHPGITACPQPVGRILKHQAVSGPRVQHGGRPQVHIRCRLAQESRVVIPRQNGAEVSAHARYTQIAVHHMAGTAAAQAHLEALALYPLEQLAGVRFDRQTATVHLPPHEDIKIDPELFRVKGGEVFQK
ncbi:hypothetical protein SDC9_207066 [bioreactor metagenome]|uniref:Uncharacterized protein n=1 Tax=bioreactor metagenome TaxID=1076179 RepID=A0A645J6K3_9ZZZZ